jgi:hypothetical protein
MVALMRDIYVLVKEVIVLHSNNEAERDPDSRVTEKLGFRLIRDLAASPEVVDAFEAFY